jgi:GTP cyclohydrolase II
MSAASISMFVAGDNIRISHREECPVSSDKHKSLRFATPQEALEAIESTTQEKVAPCQVSILSTDAATGQAVWNELIVGTVPESKGVLSITIKPTRPVSMVFFDSDAVTTTYDTQPTLACPRCGGNPKFTESAISIVSYSSTASDTLSEDIESDGTLSPCDETCCDSHGKGKGKGKKATGATKTSTGSKKALASSSSVSSTSSQVSTEPLKMKWDTFKQVFLALTASALPPGSPVPGLSTVGRSFSKSRVSSQVSFLAETNLPTLKGTYRVRAYQDIRKPGKEGEYVCVIWGKIEGLKEVPVRVHDQCFTSEVLGSMKCDCREQLAWAMDYIKDEERNEMKCGMVVYLPQEGRGIGLGNKLRAYQMQEFGLDTVDANRVLGLPDDSREYKCVPAILKHMGIESVKLITNNPRKVKTMTHLGVKIVERIPCLIPSNPHSDLYIKIKRSRMGHMKEAVTTE